MRRSAADARPQSPRHHSGLFVSVLVAESVEDGRTMFGTYASATYGLALAELETVQAVVMGRATMLCPAWGATPALVT